MAQIAASAIAPVANVTVTKTGEFFETAFSANKNVEKLSRLMERAISVNETMKIKEVADLRRGRTIKPEVQQWFKDFKTLHERWEKIKARYEKSCTVFCGCSPNLFSAYSISSEAQLIVTDVGELIRLEPAEVSLFIPPKHVRKPSHTIFIGRNGLKEELGKDLEGQQDNIIGLYGPDGVGKTELMLRLHNDLSKSEDFDWIIWVDMPANSDAKEIRKIIAVRLNLLDGNSSDVDIPATWILHSLKDARFLLLLDNVQQKVNLTDIGIPTQLLENSDSNTNVGVPPQLGENSHSNTSGNQTRPPSKIIFTSTNKDAMKAMYGRTKDVEVPCLSTQDSQDLFTRIVGDTISNPVKEIKENIEFLLELCDGLPLILNEVGQYMRRSTRIQEWNRVVWALKWKPAEVLGSEVLNILATTYDSLNVTELQSCFLYTALFANGKDYGEILEYWFCEGLIGDFGHVGYDLGNAYDEAHSVLRKLKNASLIDGDNELNLHSIFRILALWIACDRGKKPKKWIVRFDEELEVAPEAEEWNEAERISLSNNNIEELPSKLNAPHLISLMLESNETLVIIPPDFFSSMTSLKVLNLCHTKITELPKSIGQATQLRYLNLCDTMITSLPEEFGNLVMLIFLELSWTPQLARIPTGVMQTLIALRVLYMHVSYHSWGDGVQLSEMEKLRRLRALGITVSGRSQFSILNNPRRLAPYIVSLHIRDFGNERSLNISTIIDKMPRLTRLRVSDCKESEEVHLSPFENNWSFESLELHKLKSLLRITWNGKSLDTLTELEISNCPKIVHLLERATGDTGMNNCALPNLRSMELQELKQLERFIAIGTRTLEFPLLTKIAVENCPKLVDLPQKPEGAGLLEIHGRIEWWNSLSDDVKKPYTNFKEL